MNDNIFPKRIGIIFLEKLEKVEYKQKYKPSSMCTFIDETVTQISNPWYQKHVI